jgi:ribosomal protein L40E
MGVQDRAEPAENQTVTTARCPACGASMALGAPWCTLCYADLRPKPEPAAVAEPAAAAAVATVAAVAAPELEPATVGAPSRRPLVDALGVIPPGPMPVGVPLAPDPHLDAPIAKAADIRLAEPGWPCRHCGTVAPMAEDNCPQCHAPFLVPEDVVEVSLPVVGNVRKLDTKMRTILGLVGALGVTLVLVILAVIAGTIL